MIYFRKILIWIPLIFWNKCYAALSVDDSADARLSLTDTDDAFCLKQNGHKSLEGDIEFALDGEVLTWNLLKTNRKMTYISANPWRNELHGIDEHGLIYEMTDISNPSWNQIDLGIIEKPTAIISNDSSKLIAVKGIKVYHHQSNSLSLVMSHSSPDYDIKHLSWTSRCLFLTFNTNWQQYSTSIIEKAYGFPEIGHYRQVSCLETHCWGANRNSMVFARISGSCGVHHDAYKNRQNIDYVSVAVTKTEVWGIQSGGKVITRRLQVIPDSSSMYGNDWFDFPLFLPKPAKWIAIGKMGVFVLLTSGEVAVFQGFIHPKVPSVNLFAQIDTFDDQLVIALTSSGGNAYVLKDAVNGQWDTSLTTTTGIKQISVGQDKIYGLLSNDSLGKYDKDTKTFVPVGAPRPMKYIGAGSIGTLYYVEMNRKLSCLNISLHEYDYNQHTSGSSHYIAVECGEKHCWLLTNVDYTPHRYIIIFPRGESCLSGGGFNDGKTWISDQHNLLFDSLDTNKAGKTWMIQRSIEDVFYRYGVSSSNMLGEKWINVPGLKLVDVAVGKDTVYGITKDNKFVYFDSINGSWSQWSSWSNCSYQCGGGIQRRSRTCFSPSPRLNGKPCQGSSADSRLCSLRQCNEDEAYLINYIKEVEGSTDIETEYIQTGSLCQISTNLLNSNYNGDDITTAFVFENIQIPNNASIEQAFLELQSRNASEYAEANTQIAISKFDKSDSIKGCLFKDSSHYASTALIDWNMPQWYIGETYESPDISSLIRYVINTNDWKEGNDIILVVKNKLAPTSSQQRKIHYNQTKLKISYRNMKKVESCIWAKSDDNGTIECCSFNATERGLRFYNECFIVRDNNNCTFKCALDRYGTRFGKCLPIDSYWTSWSAWSSCNGSCYGGYQNRSRRCTKINKYFGIEECPGESAEERLCNMKGCSAFTCPESSSALGISHNLRTIPDSAITASTSHSMPYWPQNARLYNVKSWLAGRTDQNQYLQIDLSKNLLITAVATQGRAGANDYVKTYQLEYLEELDECDLPSDWKYYQEGGQTKTFQGNTDYNSVVKNSIAIPFMARLVRFRPKSSRGHIALRVEVYGCQGCGEKAENATGSERCCHLPFEQEGQMRNYCVPEHHGSRVFKCPLDRYNLIWGRCPAVHGNWTSWSQWTDCTYECFGGTRTRHRNCTDPCPKYGGNPCQGEANQTEFCNMDPCPGCKIRALNETGGGVYCCYLPFEHQGQMKNDCVPEYHGSNVYRCPLDRFNLTYGICPAVHGDWTNWSQWTDCSHDCFGGTRSRERNCSDPQPNYGGDSCEGKKEETENCNMHPCPGLCNVTARNGNGSSHCCFFPFKHEGKMAYDCVQDGKTGPYKCPFSRLYETHGICPAVHGNWTSWSSWTTCNHSCFGGKRERNRSCIEPIYGGDPCEGNSKHIEYCNMHSCVAPGGVGNNTCIESESKMKTFNCCFVPFEYDGVIHNDCAAINGSYQCPLNRYFTEFGLCHPIHGNWTSWSSWSECKRGKDCTERFNERSRTCSNPAPKYNGTCEGEPEERKYGCELTSCAGEWTDWTKKADCSKTCGDGQQIWERKCVDATTKKYERWVTCEGPSMNVTMCNLRQCPGYFIGDEGEHCDKVCFDQNLTCRWLEISKPNNYSETINDLNATCQYNKTTVWEKDWHPAISSSDTCLGAVNVSSSRCKPDDNMDNSYRRLCRCIYPEDAPYTEWSKWSVCSSFCGNGYRERQRQCEPGQACEDKYTQTSICVLPTCAEDLGFSPWGSWEPCSAPCGGGTQQRHRDCTDPSICFPDRTKEIQICNTSACKVDGGLTDWTPWTDCTKSCGFGVQIRRRSCTNPAPLLDGKNCTGDLKEEKPCNQFYCSGIYLSLQGKQCSASCSSYSLLCYPYMTAEDLTDISINCSGSQESDSMWKNAYDPSFTATEKRCHGLTGLPPNISCDLSTNIPSGVQRMCKCMNSSDIGYGPWSNFGECPITCGKGRRARYRECLPGKECNGTTVDYRECDTDVLCKVDGGWSSWTIWSPCDKSCNGGKMIKYRTCTNPEPRNGGRECDGDKQRSKDCNVHICPINGLWGTWSEWSSCNRPCNGGRQRMKRRCDSPEPQFGGKYCIGIAEKIKSCANHSCESHSVDLTCRFTEEIYNPNMKDLDSPESKKLTQNISNTVVSLYGNGSHVTNLTIHSFDIFQDRKGSVIVNFTIHYSEISSDEIVLLKASMDETGKLGFMPVQLLNISSSSVPPAPSGVTGQATGMTSIRVTWTDFSSSLNTMNITGFGVTYREAMNSSQSWMLVGAPASSSEILLEDLKIFTTYTIRVMAFISTGSGLPSDLFDVKTSEGAPSESPTNVSCKTVSSTKIGCDWNEIPPQGINGNLRGYRIKFRLYDAGNRISVWNSTDYSISTKSAEISMLKEYTRYEVMVLGFTAAGESPPVWTQLLTDQDVPGAPPSDPYAVNFLSDLFVEVFWGSIPSDQWNGEPISIIVKYWVSKQGANYVAGRTVNNIVLDYDRRFYRILDLEFNTEVSVVIMGATIVGSGKESSVISGKTCQCPRRMYVSWHATNPYAFERNGKVVGIFPEFMNTMLKTVCGNCSAYRDSPLFFDRSKSGRNQRRTSEIDLKTKISNDVHFHLTVTGRKELTVFQNQYQFVQVVESPGSAFIVVDQSKLSKTEAIFTSLVSTWPVFLMAILMASVAGMFIWVFDKRFNPKEFPDGRFLRGTFEGFWWAFISMTTVGYGDKTPIGFIAKWIAIFWTLIGLVINGILIGVLSTAVTTVTIGKDPTLYGTKVSAIEDSFEYNLGIRRNAKVNTTGETYKTSAEAVSALIQGKVEGALLEIMEASNMQGFLEESGLKIAKLIKSGSGFGIVLTGGLEGLHPDIRAYVTNNNEMIRQLVKNYTKPTVVKSTDSATDEAVTLFEAKSALFKDTVMLTMAILLVLTCLGILWNFLRPRLKIIKTLSEKNNDKVLFEMVDGFVESYSHKVEDVYKEHCRARMRLMEKRQGNSTYGLKAWWIYGTTDEILIMSKIKLEEFFMFQLERNRIETKTSQNCNENKSTSVVTNEQEPENDYWASKDSTKFLVKETAKNGTSTKYMT